MEEDQNSEELEVTPQDQEATIVEQESQVDSVEDTQAHEDDKQEKNWRELRRKEQEAQQKLKMQEELIKNLLQAQKPQEQAQQPVKEVDEFADISEEEYLTKGQSRKMLKKDARDIAREEFLRLEKEREQSRFLDKLKSRYSDFEEVVNPETIAILEKEEPDLAETIADLKDPYKMGLQTYKFIKAKNFKDASTEKRHAKEVQKKIDKNEKEVQSPQAYNKRPMAQAFSMSNMSKDEQSKLYEEMMGYASQSAGY